MNPARELRGLTSPTIPEQRLMDLQLTSDSLLTWERLQTCRVSVPNHVVHRGFASEAVLLNVQTGIYYGMDEIGTRFFDVLRECGDVPSAMAILTKEFQAPIEQIRKDMVRYCSELQKLGLIGLREAGD
jgi:hypothetical protein